MSVIQVELSMKVILTFSKIDSSLMSLFVDNFNIKQLLIMIALCLPMSYNS